MKEFQNLIVLFIVVSEIELVPYIGVESAEIDGRRTVVDHGHRLIKSLDAGQTVCKQENIDFVKIRF